MSFNSAAHAFVAIGVAGSREPAGPPASGQSVLAQLVPEAALADAEEPGGPCLHLSGLVEGAEDHLALEAIHRLVEPDRARLGLRYAGLAEVEQPGADRSTAAQHDGALDDVLELAHVPRPGIALQETQRALGDAGASSSARANRRRKCATRNGMSSRRSRSAGSAISTTRMR